MIFIPKLITKQPTFDNLLPKGAFIIKSKRNNKRLVMFASITVALLSVILLLSLCIFPLAAGVDLTQNGRTFTALENIAMDKSFSEMPSTFEAWIRLPAGRTERSGAVISNYRASYDWCDEGMAIEIHENGKPQFYVDNGEKVYDVKFNANVATGEWVHLAITLDRESGVTECFVNGASVGTSSALANVKISKEVITSRPLMIGGSYERYNPQYFKGEIGTVEIFSDKRTASEILNDYTRGVPNNENGLIAQYDLFGTASEKESDLSGGGYNLSDKMFLDSTEYTPVTDFAYSFAIVGDTQRVTELYPEHLPSIYQWIADNRNKEKIQFVFGLGDITEQSTVKQWTDAKNAIKILEDAGIPYSLARGNHDMKTTNPTGSTRLGMNDVYADYDNYTSQFGGFYNDDITNSWRAQRVGEIDYLFLTLDYGASDDMLRWASEVVEAHPNHKVIVTTHGYEYYSGDKLGFNPNKGTIPAAANDYEFKKYADNPNVRDYNSGVDIWNDFASKHKNIFLILSGHEGSDDIIYHTETGVNGNRVTSFLINPQGADDKFSGLAMVCLFKFSEDGREIYVEYYSLMKQSYFKSLNQFTLTVPQEECSQHTITRYSLLSAATCEKNAVKCDVCDVCGYTDKIEIEGTKHAHAIESYKTVFQATCESNALELGVCTFCKKTVTRERPNTATGHVYGTSDSPSSTCTACGKARKQEPVS